MSKPTDVGALLKASRERRAQENETDWGAIPQSSWFPQAGRSPDFFPPDVRVRIDQDVPETDPDLGTVDPMLGVAKNLLFKALLMKERGAILPVRLSRQINDKIWATVHLTGDQKIVRITTQNPSEPLKKKETEEEEFDSVGKSLVYMLCGETRGNTTVTVDTVDLLRDFAPTPATSFSHSVPLAFTDNKKLGECASDLSIKASSFSGAMKRVVQAVQGMGRIDDNSIPYIQTDPPQESRRSVHLHYLSKWWLTHGIYKAGPKNHWLIGIGSQEGILAMPLPLIGSTTDPGYLRYLDKIGDSGGAAVVREFGGLPSGESFPTGAVLTDAITKKKILRLLPAEQLLFYSDDLRDNGTGPYSWAFSESGSLAFNVRFIHKRDPDEPTDTRRFMFSEHWQVSIDLSRHKIIRPEGDPIGTGSASINMLSSGKIPSSAVRGIWSNGGFLLTDFVSTSLPEPYDNPMDYYKKENIRVEPRGWGAVVHAFFIGDQPVTVKWVPMVVIGMRLETLIIELPDPTGLMTLYGTQFGKFITGVQSVSPAAFVTDFYDPRMVTGIEVTGIGYDYKSEYDIQSIIDANPEVWNYYYGVVAPSDLVTDDSWCMVPANCREGVVIPRVLATYTGPQSPQIYNSDAQGSFDGAGHLSIYAKGIQFNPANGTESCMFDAVVNAGPSTAYVMTGAIKADGTPQEYTRVNLRPDAGPVKINNTTFIGSY